MFNYLTVKVNWKSGSVRLAAATLLCATTITILYPTLFVFNLLNFSMDLLPIGLIISFIGLTTIAIFKRRTSPLSYISEILRQRGIDVILSCMTLCIGMAAFWTFKYHYPSIVPFYADPILAEVDRTLHFGDPWRWTHAILPRDMEKIFVIIYFPMWIFLYFSIIVLVSFSNYHELRIRYFRTFFYIYFVLGTVIATMFSSVGPIYYDNFFGGDRFLELTSTLQSSQGSSFIIVVSERLLSAYRSGVEDYFAGISAMPSIHVAITVLNALFLASMNRLLGIAGSIFVVLTLFGSVHFGWHYAIDGYVSIIAVLLMWRAVG